MGRGCQRDFSPRRSSPRPPGVRLLGVRDGPARSSWPLSRPRRAVRLALGVATLLLAAACAAPVPAADLPAGAAAAPLPATTPIDASALVPSGGAVASTPAPGPTPRLQSEAEGPVEEQVAAVAPGQPAEPLLAPIPSETITPADQCDPTRPATPLGPGMPGGFSAFRAPLPATPLYNPPGTKRVGLQAGHWKIDEVPPELERLQGGASGGGKQEWEVNLEIGRRAAAQLAAAGYAVDVLTAAVPIRYQAQAFVSIHADGDPAGVLSGYKIARPGFSSVPEADDQLVAALYAAYGPATALERDDEHISRRMTYYYAFNSRRYCSAVAPGVPQAIIETGFLTSAADRQVLIGNPDAPARGIAAGVTAFLESLP